MRRFLLLLLLSIAYLVVLAVITLVAMVGIFNLRIGPVVWTFAGSHGIHMGDVVIAAIATCLVGLFTIGIVLAARQR